MEISEAKIRREKLENSILSLLLSFELDTGLKVSGIRIDRDTFHKYSVGSPVEYIDVAYRVNLDISLK